MDSHVSSRYRSKRDLESLAVRRKLWDLRFYVWGRMLLLLALSAQAVEIVVALAEGRQPILVVDHFGLP